MFNKYVWFNVTYKSIGTYSGYFYDIAILMSEKRN